jgi:hypothetical protein
MRYRAAVKSSLWLVIIMDSHTVPEKLLKQFAFQHAKKGLRLWRYQKGREPYWDVSPHKATVIVGHFADPRDGEREESIETKLNLQFENPVHDFIEQLSFRTFVLSARHSHLNIKFTERYTKLGKAHMAKTSNTARGDVETAGARKSAHQLRMYVVVQTSTSRRGNYSVLHISVYFQLVEITHKLAIWPNYGVFDMLLLLAAALYGKFQIRIGIRMYRYLTSSFASSGRIWPALCASLNSSRTSPVLPIAFRKSMRYWLLNPTTNGS